MKHAGHRFMVQKHRNASQNKTKSSGCLCEYKPNIKYPTLSTEFTNLKPC